MNLAMIARTEMTEEVFQSMLFMESLLLLLRLLLERKLWLFRRPLILILRRLLVIRMKRHFHLLLLRSRREYLRKRRFRLSRKNHNLHSFNPKFRRRALQSRKKPHLNLILGISLSSPLLLLKKLFRLRLKFLLKNNSILLLLPHFLLCKSNHRPSLSHFTLQLEL